MATFLQNGLTFFEKKINLLIVDDDAIVRDSLSGIFVSPLFNISTTSSWAQACDTIEKSQGPWHCWIVDIDLGKGQCGLDLLSRYPEFKYTIVLSGLGRMSLAAEAIRLGAAMVFDKDPLSIEPLHDKVCKTAALGFLLNGKRCAHIELFQILFDETITTIEEWARRGCIELRKLHRICELYPPLTPNYALALYRAVYCLLRNPPGSNKKVFSTDDMAKYEQWIDSAVRKYRRGQ